MEKTKVAIVGLGTVGTGVARLLLEFGERLARHSGRTLELEKAVVRDLKKPRDITLPPGVLTDDLKQVTNNPDIKAVALLIGGLEPARTIMLKLLSSGKDVITANKALLAEHGPEVFDRARELGRSIAFEASVAGGIPIVAAVGQSLSANQIQSLHGILNGTCNFIISQMDHQGARFEDALAEAQKRGYAEADPTMDIDGSDAAQKLSILAQLSFGARVPWRNIPREGIQNLQPADLRFARELGYRIKLLAVAQLAGEGLELHVAPQLVKVGSPLADVRDAYNAIRLVGDAVGRVWFHGLGAGQMATASAVVADLIDTVVGRTAITFRTLELWSQRTADVTPRAFDEVRGRFYLRFDVDDHPGVLAEIAGILGEHSISIASVIQHEAASVIQQESAPPRSVSVPLVIMTHLTTEGAIRKAMTQIDQLKSVRGRSVRIRVHD